MGIHLKFPQVLTNLLYIMVYYMDDRDLIHPDHWKHYKNLLDQQPKMLKQVEKWREEGAKKKKAPQKPMKQEVGEF